VRARRALVIKVLSAILILAPFAYALPALGSEGGGSPVAVAVAWAAPEGGAGTEGASLESAATKAGETGRKVAMSLIGLAFAVAAVVLAFKRDFREAAGVFVVGVIAVLLASQAGISLMTA
jgi:hypothetical protein